MKAITAAALLALSSPSLNAQGWIEPRLRLRPEFGIIKLRTEVSVRLSGRIAEVEVNEWFQNRGQAPGEGDYLYPLAGEAVFSNFSLYQGDLELRGEIMDAAAARGTYEEIVRRRKDPALIELVGHGLIRARVFPIGPGETRRITLRYTELVERAGDALVFRYAAGRHRPFGMATGDGVAPAIAQLPAAGQAPLVSFRLVADSAGLFGNPFSPTHALQVEREGNRLVVRPDAELRGDLTIFLPLARKLVGATLLTHRSGSEPGYFLLTLSPGQAPGRSLPRDLVAVLDVSGSMSGPKIEQGGRAIMQLLGSLEERDRFRLLAFSSQVTAYRPDWTKASASEVEQARRWLESLGAGGGTNIEAALAEAFREEGEANRLSIVVFITDGLPSVGERNPERLASQVERSRGTTRIFTFGVGYDVNVYLLERLAASGRGAAQYLRPGEDVEQAVGSLAAKIAHPVLTDLELRVAPAQLSEVYPRTLPDLFAGEELVILGRYQPQPGKRAGSGGEVVVAGSRGGERVTFSLEAEFPEYESGNRFIPRLWAARKIGSLGQALRLHGPDPELEQEIRETALRYGLLSEYTSYLVQEPLEVAARPGLLRDNLLAPSLATPETATGKMAVEVAERSRLFRELTSVAELREAEQQADQKLKASGTRLVEGRLFALRNGAWTDLYYEPSLAVVRIAPYSRAYFDLLALLPEIIPYWREFERVVVAGNHLALELAPDGLEHLSATRLAELVEKFRGTGGLP